MLCFLLINFIEDIEIYRMFIDHFPKKSKLRLSSLLISEFINDQSLVLTIPLGIVDAGY